MSRAKKMFFQIPDFLIRNEGVNINATDFALFCVLKHQYFQTNSITLTVDHMRLKRSLILNDGRVLKKSLLALHAAGVITNEIAELPRKGALEVTLDEDVINRKPFTQLPVSLFERLEEIGHLAFRLLFYYESHITRGTMTKQFCFSSYKTITDRLGISEVTLSKYNTALNKAGLLRIDKSVIHTDYNYDQSDKLMYTRYNNHYTPVIERM